MDTKEFSYRFNTLLNSYSINPQFGEETSKQEVTLDEYEKSIFLTEAVDIVTKRYFYAQQNPEGQGFDNSERRQIDFSNLIKSTVLNPVLEVIPFDNRGIMFKLPENVLILLNERLVASDKEYVIKPIHYREYDRSMSKAYTQPLKKQAWRLFQNNSAGFDAYSEIIPRKDVPISKNSARYKIRYVEKPGPIVLVNLPDGLTVGGKSAVTECTLNESLHTEVLNEAVRLALISKGINTQQTSNKE